MNTYAVSWVYRTELFDANTITEALNKAVSLYGDINNIVKIERA